MIPTQRQSALIEDESKARVQVGAGAMPCSTQQQLVKKEDERERVFPLRVLEYASVVAWARVLKCVRDIAKRVERDKSCRCKYCRRVGEARETGGRQVARG